MTINPDILDPTTDAQLRTLDAAGPVTTDDRARADALVASIVATDPAATPAPALPRGRHPVRWAAAAAGLAAVSAGALGLSTLGAPAAYATWTATPAQVAAADNAVFEKACRDKAGSDSWYDAATLDVRLTERRGDYVALLLAGTGKDPKTEANVSCLGRLPVGGRKVDDLSVGASGGGGFAAPTGREFFEGAMSQFAMGANFFGAGGEPASFVYGPAGPEIAGLTIHSFDGTSVEASIKDGTYAAWWPGAAFDLSGPLPPSGEGGPQPQLTYDLVLTDGTVLTGVSPTRPHDADIPPGAVSSTQCPPTCGSGTAG